MRNSERNRQQQLGATAMEFALIFPLLFALLYGVVVYSYVFVLKESITYAAQQAASVAVKVSPLLAAGSYESTVRERVRAGAVATLNWLPQSQQQRVLGTNGEAVEVTFPTDNPAGSLVAVELNFDLGGMFPAMDLPFIGEFPPLPETLTASASVVVGEP